jgi:hypothetical protein
MGKKKQIVSAKGTYVFDPEEIAELDELSLTTVLSDVLAGSTEQGQEPESPNNVAPQSLGDTTINELLSDAAEPDDEHVAHSGLPGTPQPAEEAPGDLIDPDALFPELTTSKGGKKR